MESVVSHKTDYRPMPITASFAGLHESSKVKLSSSGNGVANMDELRPFEVATVKAKSKATRYRECNRNHAINSGGYSVDGCGEFMPGGEEGTAYALKCAACDCHRNFHRKEIEGEATCDCKNFRHDARKRGLMTAPVAPSHHHGAPQPLALQSPAQIINRVTQSAPYLLGPGPADSDDGDGGLSGSPSNMKKRFRTKFTTEQKEKMGAFAEKLGWKIQKHDEAAVQEFCAEVGVKRHVLKVWMHNNKLTIGKKVESLE